MSSQYYSLCECFEMLADTTIPQLLAEFPLAQSVANMNAPLEPGLTPPLYVVHPETVAAANRLAAAAASAEAPAYVYFAPGEAQVDARPGTIANAAWPSPQPAQPGQPAQLDLFAATTLDLPAPALQPVLRK